ncbi:hypothetical protein Peur_010217 [Populus x canadensis]
MKKRVLENVESSRVDRWKNWFMGLIDKLGVLTREKCRCSRTRKDQIEYVSRLGCLVRKIQGHQSGHVYSPPSPVTRSLIFARTSIRNMVLGWSRCPHTWFRLRRRR